jgi:hypothetical protein
MAPALFLLGAALVGCNGGGGASDTKGKGDEVKPELPRVTIEVHGMT